MLGFLFHKKRDEVHRVLHGRMNRAKLRTLTSNDGRSATRGIVTEVVWVLPCDSPSEADFTRVYPAVTKDLSVQGIAIFQKAPITESCVLIGLKHETDWRFLACTPKNQVPLGFGFYQIGLFPDEVINVTDEDFDTMCTALEPYGSVCSANEPAGHVILEDAAFGR